MRGSTDQRKNAHKRTGFIRQKGRGWIGGVLAAIACLVAAPGLAETATTPQIDVLREFRPLPESSRPSPAANRPARPTAAWTSFCERLPAECRIDAAEPTLVTLTTEIWQQVVDINQKVNETILPVTDRAHWNVEDRWDYPDDGQGDCEDIQILKRKRLVEAGLPRRALRMAVVINPAGEGHAVLLVRTDRGDLVLDNQTNRVLPWYETGHKFLIRESQNDSSWVAFEQGPVMVSSAKN
jgi:predicted transglutaminase-like cysteine proteinase